jgi:hypothetical protein
VGTASRRSPATPHRDSTLALVATRPSETRVHDYDEVIPATGRQGSSRLSRLMGWHGWVTVGVKADGSPDRGAAEGW